MISQSQTVSKREWQAYLDLKKRIRSSTAPDLNESAAQRASRIKRLLSNPQKFIKYYFPHYLDSEFGWFHRKALREIQKDENIFLIAEWAREHAKSVFFDVMIPLWLLAKDELTGMILASATQPKAAGLLKDIQAELESNQRFIADFGDQKPSGQWADGHFTTTGGVGFWGFGLGQNPAGVREAEKRPNYGVIDDADDKRKGKNQQRVEEDVDWCLGEFFGCLSIKGARKVYANNRVHKQGLTAHMVGDVKEGDPFREGTVHIKVFATEDPRTHKKLMPDAGGVPAWKERYTLTMLTKRFSQVGYRNAMRQYFHEHQEIGHIFKPEMVSWVKTLPLHKYDHLITYNDPSWKGTKTSDYKAIVLIGKTGPRYHVIFAWIRQTNPSNMVGAHYQVGEMVEDLNCPHYIETGLMQDQHMEHYRKHAETTGVMLRIRPDNRKKPDKTDRIADLEPLFAQGLIGFNEKLRKDSDMQRLVSQLLAFPNDHDDGPDALEGGIWILNKRTRASNHRPRSGKYKQNTTRRA